MVSENASRQAGNNRSRAGESETITNEKRSKQKNNSITEYILLETKRVLAVTACGVGTLSRYFAGEGCAVSLLRGLDGVLADGLVQGVIRVVTVHAVAAAAIPEGCEYYVD